MKAFEFNIKGYEAKRNGNTLFIWELDHEGDRLHAVPLEITLNDLSVLVDESERLQAYHNPTCSEVTDARTDLENARGKSGHDFEVALSLYMSVANRHREGSDCTVMH
jgi:hypothetical protein